MRFLSLGERERRGKICSHMRCFGDSLDECLVEFFLIRCPSFRNCLLLEISGASGIKHTFSPSPKNSCSVLFPFFSFLTLKYASSYLSKLNPLGNSTLVLVAMTYAGLILLRGTPLILKGPVTCLSMTTRFPRKRPARTMQTVPGVN
jgi:hypothetical protein